MSTTSERAAEQVITSELVIYPSLDGKKVVAFLDHAGDEWEGRPFVVVTPKYGESKKNNIQLAYYLAANGLNILRFDHTRHVGESDGSMFDFTLQHGVEDIIASTDYLQRRFGISQVSLVASSLSARTALRAAATDVRVRHLVSVVGVVNVRDTLFKVYREDLISEHIGGRVWGVGDMLGHEADFDIFLKAAVDHDLHDFDGTIRDLEKVEIPVSMFPAEADTWVDFNEITKIRERFHNVRVHLIVGAMHEVRENLEASEKAFRQIVKETCRWAYGREIQDDAIRLPDKRTMLRQNKLERERLKRARPVTEKEPDFWSKYLKRYELMEQVGDYQEYLNLVGDLFGPIQAGDVLLDAGCGNGLLGLWVIRDLVTRGMPFDGVPPFYLGIDLTSSGLGDAFERHTGGIVGSGVSDSPLGLAYMQMDFDSYVERAGGSRIIDFDDGTFDKIACSLLISYLKHPEALVKEMHRLLRPGGRIVLSSMKPFCDLSMLYRDYVEGVSTPDELDAARNLLRAAGAIKVKEDQGYYRFYYGEELLEVLRSAGFVNCEAVSSLANQAFVASASK
jgi:SAM-dependent methyltransferase/pimeloyl-ACP methyl ester carboxylesterase